MNLSNIRRAANDEEDREYKAASLKEARRSNAIAVYAAVIATLALLLSLLAIGLSLWC